MNQDSEKGSTNNNFDLAWCFNNNQQSLSEITILSKEQDGSIWKSFLDAQILLNYSLNKEYLINFEMMHFQDDWNLVIARLKELKYQLDIVKIVWNAGQIIETTLQNFSNNFDDFFYPSSDDILILNKSQNWIVYISHFEMFQYGEMTEKMRLT